MSGPEDIAHARDLIARCDAVIAETTAGDGVRIPLVLPRPAGSGATMRLFGRRGGPRGEVLCQNADGHTVCSFDPREVKLALEAAIAEAAS